MPMAWPFLSSVRNASVAPTTSQTTSHLTATQQLLLAPRAVPRRRYLCYMTIWQLHFASKIPRNNTHHSCNAIIICCCFNDD